MAKGTGAVAPGKGPAKGGMPMKKGQMPIKGGKGCDGCGGKKKGKQFSGRNHAHEAI